MAKITCTIDETILENGNGQEIPSIVATCSRCGHTTESYGTSERSVNRCLVLMNEECPNGENNFYEEED
jgi:hypothetical protein